MDLYEGEKYHTTKENLRQTLEEYGVAIIPNVLDEQECNHMFNGIWDYFEHISQTWETPLDRNDESTFRGFYDLFPMHSMLIQYFSIGHNQASWNVRQNPKIVDIFSHFWNVYPEDLLVSFDALSFNIPPEITNKGWFRKKEWFHSDQSFTRNDFECVQSWVTALDVNPGDATLSILESSHKYHSHAAEKFKLTDKGDWYKLNDEEKQFYFDNGCEIKRIKCPKGSLVFWDSRTIHCGVEALKERPISNYRAVIYLCYSPRSKATKKDLKKKIEAFENLRTMNHWPHKPKLFPKSPRTYGKTLPEITIIDPPCLTYLGTRLAGYE